MSHGNIERVHRVFDALNRRELDAALELVDPEVEFTTRFLEMEGDAHYRGHDGMREWWGDLLAVFPDFKAEILDAREIGEIVIASAGVRGHGVGSDVPFEETLWGASRWRDGKTVWWRTSGTEAEALEAAGLEA
jgi:ketosteroid isomerase-like protein